MNDSEAAMLLALAASYDRRTVGVADARAWAAVLADVSLDEGLDAVKAHYGASTEWLMPAHVRHRVKTWREARLAREVMPAPAPELADDLRAYKAALDRSIERIADGRSVGRALAAGKGQPPSEVFVAARGEGPERRIRLAAQEVICPRCAAAVGERCINPLGKPLGTQPAHEARLIAAGLAEPPRDARPLSPAVIASHPGLRLVARTEKGTDA